MSVTNEEPNVIGINEVKPKNNRYPVNPAEFNLEDLNYDMFENNIETDTGRGQLLYTSKDLKATQVYFDSKFEESVFVELNLKDGDSLIIGLLYRSGSGEEMNNKEMNNIITEVCANGYSHILLMGDFDYRTIDWEAFHSDNKVEMKFVENVIENGLIQNSEFRTHSADEE